jgi:hypothetical protein
MEHGGPITLSACIIAITQSDAYSNCHAEEIFFLYISVCGTNWKTQAAFHSFQPSAFESGFFDASVSFAEHGIRTPILPPLMNQVRLICNLIHE